jgi:predicted NUDIX family NTP pyrophosphohydrolase
MREFEEEIGSPPPKGEFLELGECRQSSGKIITTYALEGDFDLAGFHSNTFAMEWPKGSGTIREFPEVDRADWVSFDRASELLVKGQVPIVTALRERLLTQGARVDQR